MIAAIVKAVCDTGGTISAAGIIMLLVFGGMLLSDQGTVNQVSLCVFVLYQTVANVDHIGWIFACGCRVCGHVYHQHNPCACYHVHWR